MKPTTEIRNLRAALRRESYAAREERQAAIVATRRLAKAEQDAAEWKARFDALLARIEPRSLNGRPASTTADDAVAGAVK